jgi:hypothetical protein
MRMVDSRTAGEIGGARDGRPRQSSVIAVTQQSRKRGATDADSASGAERIASDLRAAGFVDVEIETLEMKLVNAACVLARRLR